MSYYSSSHVLEWLSKINSVLRSTEFYFSEIPQEYKDKKAFRLAISLKLLVPIGRQSKANATKKWRFASGTEFCKNRVKI